MSVDNKYNELVQKTGFQQLVMKGKRQRYHAGDKIIEEGSKVEALYWVNVGAVKINLDAGEGRETFIARLEPGEFFGESSLLPNLQLKSLAAEALKDSLVLQLAKDDFIEVSSRYPDVWLELIEQQSQRLDMVTKRLRETQVLSVQSRLLSVLSENIMKSTAQVTVDGTAIRISRQELADIVGCTREMVSKALQRLDEEGQA